MNVLQKMIVTPKRFAERVSVVGRASERRLEVRYLFFAFEDVRIGDGVRRGAVGSEGSRRIDLGASCHRRAQYRAERVEVLLHTADERINRREDALGGRLLGTARELCHDVTECDRDEVDLLLTFFLSLRRPCAGDRALACSELAPQSGDLPQESGLGQGSLNADRHRLWQRLQDLRQLVRSSESCRALQQAFPGGKIVGEVLGSVELELDRVPGAGVELYARGRCLEEVFLQQAGELVELFVGDLRVESDLLDEMQLEETRQRSVDPCLRCVIGVVTVGQLLEEGRIHRDGLAGLLSPLPDDLPEVFERNLDAGVLARIETDVFLATHEVRTELLEKARFTPIESLLVLPVLLAEIREPAGFHHGR